MTGSLNVQSAIPLSPLKIGDKVPDVLLSEFVNYKSKTARLSDFRGKLVILDFWNRWCTSCIRSFPHMEELQERFGEKIAILLVTSDQVDAVEKLAKRSPTIQRTELPFVIGDRVLHALFPHSAVPYHVWIDTEGYVMAMTNGSNATKSRIQDVLDNKEVTLTAREDQLDFNLKMSLITEGNGRQLKHLAYYSIIMHRLSGYSHSPVGLLFDSITGTPLGYRAINQTIINLYCIAYRFNDLYINGAGKTIVISNDMKKYYAPADNGEKSKWKDSNTYCYELKWPSSFLKLSSDKQRERSMEIMRQDLDRFFLIKSTVEMRKERCWILYRLNKEDKLKSNVDTDSNVPVNSVIERLRNNGWIFKNVHISAVLNRFRLANSGPESLPVIDETNYNGNIDATFDCDFSDIEETKIELARYGLGIREEVREITCLVLRDESE